MHVIINPTKFCIRGVEKGGTQNSRDTCVFAIVWYNYVYHLTGNFGQMSIHSIALNIRQLGFCAEVTMQN